MKRVLVLSSFLLIAVAAYFFNSANQTRKKSDELLENFKNVDNELKAPPKQAKSADSQIKDDSLSELKSLIVFKLQFIKQQLEKDVAISVKTWKEVYPLLVEFNQKATPANKEPILLLTPAQQPGFENWYYSYLENKPKEVQITYVNFLLYKINFN